MQLSYELVTNTKWQRMYNFAEKLWVNTGVKDYKLSLDYILGCLDADQKPERSEILPPLKGENRDRLAVTIGSINLIFFIDRKKKELILGGVKIPADLTDLI